MKKSKSICQLLPNLQCGGAEKVAINLAHDWLESGYSVEFLLMKKEGDFLSSVNSSIAINNLDCERIRGVIYPQY